MVHLSCVLSGDPNLCWSPRYARVQTGCHHCFHGLHGLHENSGSIRERNFKPLVQSLVLYYYSPANAAEQAEERLDNFVLGHLFQTG